MEEARLARSYWSSEREFSFDMNYRLSDFVSNIYVAVFLILVTFLKYWCQMLTFIYHQHPSTTLIKPYLCCKQPCMVHSTKIKALQCFSCKKSRVATIRMQKETVALHCHQCQYWNLVVVWPVSGQQLVVVLFYVRRALKEGFNVVTHW